MKVAIIGSGRWGSFLAWYSSYAGHDATVWGRPGDTSFAALKREHGNEYVKLPENIKLTDDIEQAVKKAEIVIIAISAQALRRFLPTLIKVGILGKKIVLCMKGLEKGTGKRLTEVAVECGIDRYSLAVWVGPGHIQEYVNGIPNCMIVDSYSKSLTERITSAFKTKLIRFYLGEDIIGTEVGAATKNIIGILAGMLDGANLGSLKGPLMARGAREVGRLIRALGGNPLSAYGLCHLGDYEATLFSQHSNNRKWGEMFVQGKRHGKLSEGVDTTIAVANIGQKLGIDLPLTYSLWHAIRGLYEPSDILEIVFKRDIKTEFY